MERYGEERLAEDFTAYVLFSEDVDFLPSEILDALREDYPDLPWTDTLQFDAPFSTSGAGIALFTPKEGTSEPERVTLISGQGRRMDDGVDWDQLILLARPSFPEARQAIEKHKAFLSINVPSLDQSLAARFDAARRMTCMAAVFAKLPICTAVFTPHSQGILQPHRCVEAADIAMKSEFPAFQWISYGVGPAPDGQEPEPLTAQTIGFAAFTGREIIMPQVRIEPLEAIQSLSQALIMIAQYGHQLEDGNTMGVEGEPGPHIRVRHWKQGHRGGFADMWALIHPLSSIDHEEFFGPPANKPPPWGQENLIKGDESSLRKKLGFFLGKKRH